MGQLPDYISQGIAAAGIPLLKCRMGDRWKMNPAIPPVAVSHLIAQAVSPGTLFFAGPSTVQGKV